MIKIVKDNNFSIIEVKNFWDRAADIYDGANKKIGSPHFQRFTESLKYLDLKAGDKVLNLWSRTGNAISYLRQAAGIKLYNLEVSSKMIQSAKEKFPEEIFQSTDLENINFPDNFFDSILSLETLEHAPRPLKLLREFFRVLKPGKILVMSLPPATAELPLRIYEFFFQNHGEGPHRFLPSKEVKTMLKTARLQLIIHKGTLLLPAGPQWLQKFGEKIIEIFQNTPIRELGIRQFYVCQKPVK